MPSGSEDAEASNEPASWFMVGVNAATGGLLESPVADVVSVAFRWNVMSAVAL